PQLEPLEQEWNGRDLVGFTIDRLLAEHQALPGRPSGDQMQRLAPLAAGMGSPRRLSVDGNDVGVVLAQGLDPGAEASLEQLSVEPVDHVIERVVSRDAALIGQEPPQEIEPLL